MKKKVALITGITGQDGSYLAELLVQKKYIVHGIRRRSSNNKSLNLSNFNLIPQKYKSEIHLHYGDMTDGMSLYNLINIIKPDEIYNLAALSDVHLSFKIPEYTASVNSLGLLKLLDAAKNIVPKSKFYQASTSEMFGDTSNNNLKNGPINAKIALSGKAKLLENLTEVRPDKYEENNLNSVPFEVDQMFLDKLDLSLMGTFLQGEGGVTLDNEDLITFDGFPKPVGSFEFVLSGANALVDKLISSGFIDSDTGMGARMMLSMFTIPTGEDELSSKIEFNSLGHILANGQRLR